MGRLLLEGNGWDKSIPIWERIILWTIAILCGLFTLGMILFSYISWWSFSSWGV